MIWEQIGNVCEDACPGCPLLEADTTDRGPAKTLTHELGKWQAGLFVSGVQPEEVTAAIVDEVSVAPDTNRQRFTPEVQAITAAIVLHYCTERNAQLITQ